MGLLFIIFFIVVPGVWAFGTGYAFLHDGDPLAVAIFWWAQSFGKILTWLGKVDPALITWATGVQSWLDDWVKNKEAQITALEGEVTALKTQLGTTSALVSLVSAKLNIALPVAGTPANPPVAEPSVKT